MTKTQRGRPKREDQIQKEDILKAALQILDHKGAGSLSLRGLAASLDITPMALYHHVADRSALLRELSDGVYATVLTDCDPDPKKARERLEGLLISYHKAVLQHPNLTLAIFADPLAFSGEAERITEAIRDCLAASQLEASARVAWLNCLVDFTHGSSIAIAMSCHAQSHDPEFLGKACRDFESSLKTVLNCVFACCGTT
jgi:AcrR family transcriptional regulator